MATITISRRHTPLGSRRPYVLLLDGRHAAILRRGERLTIEVTPGQHTLSARCPWCGSRAVRFSIAAGENLRFRMGPNLRGLRVLLSAWYAGFARRDYLRLEPYA